MTARRTGTAVERWQELAEVRNLIEAHRASANAWGDAYEVAYLSFRSGASKTMDDLKAFEDAEKLALHNLLTWRPATLQGEALRLRYLLTDPVGPWNNVPAAEADLLVSSMDGR